MIDFAKAPAGATHYDVSKSKFCFIRKNKAFDAEKFDDNYNFDSIPAICHVNSDYFRDYVKEIPAREIELDRLAGEWDEDQWTSHYHYGYLQGRQLFTTNNPESRPGPSTLYFTRNEWLERRTKRIEYGFIKQEVDDEWIDGLPPVGCECECSTGDRFTFPVVVEAYSIDKSVVMIQDLRTGGYICWNIDQIEFYEIETEEQKAEREVRELARVIESASNNIDKLAYANPSIVAAKAVIEWFKNKD